MTFWDRNHEEGKDSGAWLAPTGIPTFAEYWSNKHSPCYTCKYHNSGRVGHGNFSRYKFWPKTNLHSLRAKYCLVCTEQRSREATCPVNFDFAYKIPPLDYIIYRALLSLIDPNRLLQNSFPNSGSRCRFTWILSMFPACVSVALVSRRIRIGWDFLFLRSDTLMTSIFTTTWSAWHGKDWNWRGDWDQSSIL